MQNCGKLVLWPSNSFTHIEDINRGRDFVSWIFMECHWSVVCFSPACHKLGMSESFTKLSERSFNWIKWVLQLGSPVSYSCHGKSKCSLAVGLSLRSICTPLFQQVKGVCIPDYEYRSGVIRKAILLKKVFCHGMEIPAVRSCWVYRQQSETEGAAYVHSSKGMTLQLQNSC